MTKIISKETNKKNTIISANKEKIIVPRLVSYSLYNIGILEIIK